MPILDRSASLGGRVAATLAFACALSSLASGYAAVRAQDPLLDALRGFIISFALLAALAFVLVGARQMQRSVSDRRYTLLLCILFGSFYAGGSLLAIPIITIGGLRITTIAPRVGVGAGLLLAGSCAWLLLRLPEMRIASVMRNDYVRSLDSWEPPGMRGAHVGIVVVILLVIVGLLMAAGLEMAYLSMDGSDEPSVQPAVTGVLVFATVFSALGVGTLLGSVLRVRRSPRSTHVLVALSTVLTLAAAFVAARDVTSSHETRTTRRDACSGSLAAPARALTPAEVRQLRKEQACAASQGEFIDWSLGFYVLLSGAGAGAIATGAGFVDRDRARTDEGARPADSRA